VRGRLNHESGSPQREAHHQVLSTPIHNPLKRCAWAKGDLYIAYHDHEWGVPVHDDRLLFEFLILEGAQAGLNWITILNVTPLCKPSAWSTIIP
jgi:Methyladenine glycosylase